MPLYALNDSLWFPPVEEALPDGLLAAGGDLQPDRLLLAYSKGIFPWYDGEVPLWWCPNPRFVLFPEELKISRSMKAIIKKDMFEFKVNTNFAEVIKQCQTVNRKDQDGTWIKNEVIEAYTRLHEKGVAHSAETWVDGKLVGGLYGVRLGKIFFGESMFSLTSNASKFAFIRYVEQLKQEDVVLIDCQIHTSHLESLGAKFIMREQFLQILEHYI
jgi:leucyl/phenylalanyl-tRNA--protein transferase